MNRIPVKLGIYSIKNFILPFAVMSLLSIFLYVLAEFFDKMNVFLNGNIPFETILLYFLYFIPKMFFMMFPLSILFASVFVISNMNHNNELISVYGAGISTLQFSIPLLVFIFIFTLFITLFQDYYVPNTYQKKIEIEQTMFNRKKVADNAKIFSKGSDNKFFFIDRYIDSESKLTGIYIIQFNSKNELIMEINAESAYYKKNKWVFQNVKQVNYYNNIPKISYYGEKTYPFKETPVYFARNVQDIDTLTIKSAYQYIFFLKKFDVSNFEDELKFWQKFSLPMGGFIIAIFGIVAGTYFRKNVLISSILLCLIIFGAYYWIMNSFWNFGRKGFTTAFMAAWIGDILFMGIGFISMIFLKN